MEIEEIFIVVTVKEDGTEGVPAVYNELMKGYQPMVAFSREALEGLKAQVRTDPIFIGSKVTIIRLSNRETLDAIDRTN